MSSPPSSSETPSTSFHLLDERIQRWIWQKGWTELKDAQERAIPLLVTPEQDVIIAAATASGKTEAAFLPILTHLARKSEPGLALYVSPLKALINDQWSRLDELCEHLEIPVTPWHGDISDSLKKKFQKNPGGCLLITPESLEGLLIRHGYSLPALFGRLTYLVIDELHAFLENERGKQLQSQMHRLEVAVGRRVPRVGLSATLGDMQMAASFLRPAQSSAVQIIFSRQKTLDLKIIIKGYLDSAPEQPPAPETNSDSPASDTADRGLFAVAADLYKLRGQNNLIFPNSRRNVEMIADLLREQCERELVPNEFWPHHGSLSRELREETERALKAGDHPATAIATTTLELGIDIGAVKSVAQIGPAPSVASLRQRLGRSGRRRGEPAILRSYVIESELSASSSLSDQLREGLVQTTAQVGLLLRNWCEPSEAHNLHLSTLVQQLLSLIAQHSGLQAQEAWRTLCVSNLFSGITPEEFATLLRTLGKEDFLQQDPSGLLLLGQRGERFVNHYTFLAAFVGDEEFRIVTAGKTLGSLPISRPLTPGTFVIFGGRRWRVVSCLPNDKVIEVEPAKSGIAPKFDGGRGEVHDEVRAEMRRLLEQTETLPLLDAPAQLLLTEGRDNYRRLQLKSKQVISDGKDVRIFTWRGDRINDTLAVWLNSMDMPAANEGLSVGVFNTERERVIGSLLNIAQAPAPTAQDLAAHAQNLTVEKWDWVLPEALLRKNFGHRKFDIEGTLNTCSSLLSQEP